MSNILFKNISNFVDLDNTSLTITKVRISLDNEITWGTLYESNPNPVVKIDIVCDPNVVITMKPCQDCEDYGRFECMEHWQGWREWVSYVIVETYEDGQTNTIDLEDGIYTNYYSSSGTYTENHTITYAGEEHNITLTVTVNEYESEPDSKIRLSLWEIWDENGDNVDEIYIPYDSSATYEIGYDVYEIDDSGESVWVEEGSFYHTFDYSDYDDGNNTITISVEYEGESYNLSFEFNVRLGKQYYYVIEQDGDANVEFHVNSTMDEALSTRIPYVIKVYDYDSDEYIEDYDSGTIESEDYLRSEVLENYDYDGTSYTIATVYETHTIYINGKGYEFNATVSLCNADYEDDDDDPPVYMIECKECGNEYNEDLSECPYCSGESNKITIDYIDVMYLPGTPGASDGGWDITPVMSDGENADTIYVREIDAPDGYTYITFTYEGQTFEDIRITLTK